MMRDLIWEALDTAISNGNTELLGMSPDDIAVDLNRYNADFNFVSNGDMIPHIKTWLERVR